MSATSSNACRILRKTVQREFPINSYQTFNVDFPVICDGKEVTHSWEFNWRSFQQTWREVYNTNLGCMPDLSDHYTYAFSLSGKNSDGSKYDRSFYLIKIMCEYDGHDKVLAEETSDLIDQDYNRFTSRKEVTFSVYQFTKAMVEVTLQSYVIETAPQTSLRSLLDRGTLTDVVIKTQGKDFPCHKVVLASASEYFDKMFEVDMREKKESVVNWVDIFEEDVVQDLLYYVYTGLTPPNLTNTSLVLIELAHMCLMDGLKTLCAHQLKNTICVDNMGEVLRVAVKNESKELQEMTVDFIVHNFDLDEENSPPPWDTLEPELQSTLAIMMLKAMIRKRKSIKD